VILVIDNYDSFTYNLVQLLLGQGVTVEVIRNDAESVVELLSRQPAGILLSPGPGRPENAGVCIDLIAAEPDVPVLGVCLGHQALGVAFGAKVETARVLMHGKTSMVRHNQAGLFEGLPNPFEATRYHSLAVVESTLPSSLEPVAWSDDEVLMAMCHGSRPYWGVQFHPESILTEFGPGLIGNFLKICALAGRADSA
jgi:anthranilate synthase component 2